MNYAYESLISPIFYLIGHRPASNPPYFPWTLSCMCFAKTNITEELSNRCFLCKKTEVLENIGPKHLILIPKGLLHQDIILSCKFPIQQLLFLGDFCEEPLLFRFMNLGFHLVHHLLSQVFISFLPESFTRFVVESIDVHEDFFWFLIDLVNIFRHNRNIPNEKRTFDLFSWWLKLLNFSISWFSLALLSCFVYVFLRVVAGF